MQVCKDVPFTTYTTECKDVTSTKTECETVHEKSCKKVKVVWFFCMTLHNALQL